MGYHHAMSLSVDTQQILEQVEELTGKPVYLQADPALTTLVTVKPAI